MRVFHRRAMRRQRFNLLTGRGWLWLLALACVAAAMMAVLRALHIVGH